MSLNDRMSLLNTTSTASVPEALRRALDNWYKSTPIPEWVLFIMLVGLSEFPLFYRKDGSVTWSSVIYKFKYHLRNASAMAFVDIPIMGAGNLEGNLNSDEDYAEARALAKSEVPPKIQELLLMGTVRMDGSLLFDADPFRTRYEELRAEASAYLNDWLAQFGPDVDSGDAWPRLLDRVPDPPSQAPTVPPSPVQEEPAPDVSDDAALASAIQDALLEMITLSDTGKIEVMRRLVRRFGCGAARRLCMSDAGRRMGVCEDENMWQQLSRDQGWTSPPVVSETVEPAREVMVKRGKLALVMYRNKSWVEHREAEYVTLPERRKPVYNWHSYFMQRCADKRE